MINDEQNLLEYIIYSLVNEENKEKVEIKKEIDDIGVLFTLDIPKEELGKIIGKQGQTINAIRLILKIFGYKKDTKINLKLKINEN